MAVSFNKVIIGGNLVRDPELRQTNSGKSVANFTVAVNDYYTENVNYLDVVVWGKIAENCGKYLSKGRPVLVEGKLKKSKYEYKGENRYKTEIIAFNVQFLSTGSGSSGNYSRDNDENPFVNKNERKKQIKKEIDDVNEELYDEDDDIPF